MQPSSIRPSRRPTMGDVAARAGVSLKSVSRVVNAEAHVSDALAERVRRAIDELGYRPDGRARDLAAAGASRLLGFVQVDAANPFFAAVERGVEDVAREVGMLVVAGSTDAEADREVALVETLIELRVEGLVVAAAEGSDDLLRREIGRGTAVVCVDRVLPGAACDTVVSSNRASTREAVRHLLDLGHRRVAFLGGDQRIWTARERREGYRQALGEVDGVTPWEVLDVGEVTAAAAATQQLLAAPRPPTAIFAAQDRITTGAVTALHALGLAEAVALVGFDDIPFAEQLRPSVSVVAQDPAEMGRRAGRLLLDRLRDPSRPAETITVPAGIRHRRSGSIPPRT